MKQRVLFMTVGTGYDIEGYKNLANGLYTSINHNCPNKVIFFVTEKSVKTVDFLKKVYFENEQEELDSFDLIYITNPDNFNDCFEVMSNTFKNYSDYNIVVDYTSGTKTMSVTISIIAIINHYKLMSITGQRSELGVVKSNTEENKSQNPYRVYDNMEYKRFKDYFNNNRFSSAKNILSGIVSLFDDDTMQLLNNFVDLYSEWDKFHHIPPNFNTKSELFKDMNPQLQLNLKSLNIILKEKHDYKNYYILADLLNNAKRRFAEGRYDDAGARLYRSLEKIEQIVLSEKYDIDTSNILLDDLEKYELDEEYIDELNNKQKDDKIKLGLRDSYYLLYKLGDDIGKYYMDNEKYYKDILSIRNESILAHGDNPVSDKNYLKFEKLVYNIAKLLTPKLDVYIKETEFAKFK